MSDNRTTELLCKLLDERGVKYYDMQNRGIWFGISEDGKDHKFEAFEQINELIEIEIYDLTHEQAIAATIGSEREAELVRAMEDVLRYSTDTVWVGEAETLVDRMVSLGIYEHDVYEGARPWEVGE